MPLKTGRLLLITGIMIIIVMLVVIISAGRIFSHNRPVVDSQENRYVSVLGSKIRYRISGEGKPVVILLHGYGGSLDGWQTIQSRLSNGTTISLDLIGFGGSDKPDIIYSLETHRRYLVAFMDKLNIGQAVLVGGSMGGSLAAWTAAKSMERINGIVLIAPSAYPGSMYNKSRIYRWFYRPGVPNTLARIVVGNPLFRHLYPESIAQQALDVTNSYNMDFARALNEIKQPVSLAWSSGDGTALYKFHKEYLKRMPQAKFKPLPADYAHKVIKNDPVGTADLINQFVSALDSHRSAK